MGRAFEYRKARKEKRWGNMAKVFTRIGREIGLAVKSGGPDSATNPRLRAAIQNAKAANMPKDNVENAIKKASNKDEKDLEEIVYEGYGPYGVPIVIECATNNPTRTVSNIRLYLNRGGGNLGTSGSLDFMFTRKAVFTLNIEGRNIDDLELDLIDMGADEMDVHENEMEVQTPFTNYGAMLKALEEKGLPVTSSGLQRIPTSYKSLTPEEEEKVMALIEKIEDDEDVQAVYHNVE